MLLGILFMSVLLHICVAVPVDLFNLQDELEVARVSDVNYRLPANFRPESYVILLSNIDFEAATFTGQSEVVFTALANTNELKISALSLSGAEDVTRASVINLSNEAQTIQVQTIVVDELYQMLTITTNVEFAEGSRYRLSFSQYTGLMSHGMTGFYRSSYVENGVTEWLGSTQLESTHARKVFPCFDEPSYKATFALSIERPEGYEPSVSNMVGSAEFLNERTWDVFSTTPIMPTYLLAFIVSKYSVINDETGESKIFRVLAREGARGQGDYAFVEGQKLVDAMSEYMQLDYYTMGNIKMDQAAIPDFSAGAMENWGLITYREAYILSEADSTNVRYNQFISTILSHEIAHMWFGNYITCHWWSDIWLNEGFANLYEYKMTDMIDTNYDMDLQFPISSVQRALLADTPARSSPLTNTEVNSPAEISGHFSTISYQKGGSILRMMENMVGEENFRQSLNLYMRSHVYGVAVPQDVYAALQANTEVNVADVMSSWVVQSGYPVIDAYIDYDEFTMELTQKRFKKAWEEQQDTLYQVPITYATKLTQDFDDTTTDLLLTEATAIVTLPITGHQWVVLNKKQIGYYRVNYDEHSWYMLRAALRREEDRAEIHQSNKAQIVDDLFNLAREEVISYNLTLDVIDFLEFEDEYGPWQSAITGFAFIRQQFSANDEMLSRLDAHILNLLQHVVETLGFTDEGSLLTQLFRLNMMNFACNLGQEDCVEYALNSFTAYFENDESVPANHREFVYCTGLRNGSAEHFDKLWAKYLADNVVNEKVVILGALGCTRDEDKIYQLLDNIASDTSDVRTQDMMTPINSILNGNLENAEYVLRYIERNFDALRNRLGTYTTLFTNLGARMTGHQINRFYQLVIDNIASLTSAEVTAGMTAYSNLAQQNTYLARAGQEIDMWMNLRYRTGTGMIAKSSLTLLCVVLISQYLFNRH